MDEPETSTNDGTNSPTGGGSDTGSSQDVFALNRSRAVSFTPDAHRGQPRPVPDPPEPCVPGSHDDRRPRDARDEEWLLWVARK